MIRDSEEGLLWSSVSPYQLLHVKRLNDALHWKYTQYAQFNEDDSMIMVSGVHFGQNNTTGEIAVFEIDLAAGLLFRSRAINKPYDVFGCWFDNQHLLCGELSWWMNEMASSSDIYICCADPDTVSPNTPVIMPLFR
ncbi:unnamed protein product [Soboliphyme baturini]|uniref:DPPIV_N domain-containing protein n=1 Tax=Soboliphyme baturini TaxID=241478 RepID=A0A183I9Q6_9BILA|nr:unnamed protein product [Soboliphyme baturini]